MQTEDADRAAERAQAAQGQRAEALSRLQDVHRQKARHLKDSVEAVQQVGICPSSARPLHNAEVHSAMCSAYLQLQGAQLCHAHCHTALLSNADAPVSCRTLPI